MSSDSRRNPIKTEQVVVFTLGAAFGMVLAMLIGSSQMGWLIIGLLWPGLVAFALLSRAGKNKQQPPSQSAARGWSIASAASSSARMGKAGSKPSHLRPVKAKVSRIDSARGNPPPGSPRR